MDTELPLNELTFTAGSLAQDLAFVALADASLLFFQDDAPLGLLVGGQMVTLHAYRWGIGAELYRESLDTDMGVPPVVLRDESLGDRLAELGYVRTSGNTFAKQLNDFPEDIPVTDDRRAVIELLAPAYTSRPRSSVKYGEFAVTEVPGLAIALLRPSVTVDVTMTRLNKKRLRAPVLLPDEASCLILRVEAWKVRGDDRDAVDVWRALEIAYRAKVKPELFQEGPAAELRDPLARDFGSEEAAGVRAALRGRTMVPTAPVGPRIVALTRNIVAP